MGTEKNRGWISVLQQTLQLPSSGWICWLGIFKPCIGHAFGGKWYDMGSDWWSARMGCYLVGDRHVVEEKCWKVPFKGYMVRRRGNKRNVSDFGNWGKRRWKDFSDYCSQCVHWYPFGYRGCVTLSSRMMGLWKWCWRKSVLRPSYSICLEGLLVKLSGLSFKKSSRSSWQMSFL
jgi:hypothetical protein